MLLSHGSAPSKRLILCFSLLLCSSDLSLPPLCVFSTDRSSSVHHSQGSKDVAPSLGAPPPLISPKGPHHPPPPPPTTLWNPAALVDTPADSRRKLNPPTPPSRPPPGLTRSERAPMSWGEKLDDGGRRGGQEVPERLASLQSATAPLDRGPWCRAEQDRVAQGLHHWQHGSSSSLHHRPSMTSDPTTSSPALLKELPTQPPATMLVYDEVLQQHRRLLSKLDLEEKKRKEARDEGESQPDGFPPLEGALCNSRCSLLRLLLRPGRVV